MLMGLTHRSSWSDAPEHHICPSERFIPNDIIRNAGPSFTIISAASLRFLAAWPPGRLGSGDVHKHASQVPKYPWATYTIHP